MESKVHGLEEAAEAYNVLRSQGKTGLQSIGIHGDVIIVYIKEDGTFDTAYGIYNYKLEDFRIGEKNVWSRI